MGLIRTVSHSKNPQASKGKRRWRVKQWRRDRHTYIEVSCTVKTILIGHHTERETDDSGRKDRKVESTQEGCLESQNKIKIKQNKKMMEWSATVWTEHKTTNRGGDGEVRKWCHRNCEREKRRVRLLHTVQHARLNTTSLYTDAPTSKCYYCYFSWWDLQKRNLSLILRHNAVT